MPLGNKLWDAYQTSQQSNATEPGLWDRCVRTEPKVTELQKDLEQLKDINHLQAFSLDLEMTLRPEASVTSTPAAVAPLLFTTLDGMESGKVNQTPPPLGEGMSQFTVTHALSQGGSIPTGWHRA